MSHLSRRHFLSLLVGTSALAGCGSSVAMLEALPVQPQTSFDAATQSRLGRALDQAFAGAQAPGMIAGVWVGGQSWTGTRGTTTLGGAIPVSTDLSTRIASVTKTMTGTVILQLIEEGRLSFDSTLDQWFPDIEGSADITIRHLGTMASGLASYSLDDDITNEYYSDPTGVWIPEELLYSGAALPREFAPGEGFLYCNTNLVALGLIAERILGGTLAQILEQRLFAPLGMTRSSYPYGNDLPDPHWSAYTLQGSSNGDIIDSTDWSPTFTAGAGQVVSTLDDMYLWTRALGTGSFLSPQTQTERLIPNPYAVGGTRAYCFAVGVENGWIAHSGVLPGFNSQVAYLPALDATIVVLVNSDIVDSNGKSPAPVTFSALASVIAPSNVP